MLNVRGAHAILSLAQPVNDFLKIWAILRGYSQLIVSADIEAHRCDKSWTQVIQICSPHGNELAANADARVLVKYDLFSL